MNLVFHAVECGQAVIVEAALSATGMVRLVRRRAPERHDGIADVFVQRPDVDLVASLLRLDG
jgi:hypothetical protein